jgi:hypothetical protein
VRHNTWQIIPTTKPENWIWEDNRGLTEKNTEESRYFICTDHSYWDFYSGSGQFSTVNVYTVPALLFLTV